MGMITRIGSGLFLSVGVGLVIGGCTVGPDYSQPRTDVVDEWGELGLSGATTQPSVVTPKAPPVLAWWTTFQDPLLNSLIDQAVRSNLDLRRAQARVLEARAQRRVIAADAWPDVNVNGSYTFQRNSFGGIPLGGAGSGTSGGGGGSFGGGGVGGQEFDLFNVGFDSTWEIDVFGRVRRNVEAANADIEAAVEDRRDVLVSLLAEVARNYTELRSFQRQLEIARANLEAQTHTLELTRTLLLGGRATDLDVARAEAQVSRTAATIPTLEASARQSVHRLGVLLGREPMALSSELASQTPIPKPPPEVPMGVPSELLRRRPDVRRAERQLAAATARIGVATADLFPRFSLTGSLGLQSGEFKSLADYSSRFYSIGPSVSWPVFDAGRIRANIEVQNAREEQAVAGYESAVLVALRDVEDALIAYAKEQARRKTLADAAASNRRAVNLANDLFQAGRTDFLSVLQAQRDLFESDDALVQSDRAVTANLIALYKALGGGWQVSETPNGQEPVSSR
jgi:NodT family efflux transporter outer membrane factor (OMF) lipoprotein